MGEGVVIAGGRSTRFGEADKAVADLAGTPMIRRVADRIAPAVEGLVINCRAEQVAPIRAALEGYGPEVRFAEDPEPDLGPMAGIRTGLRAVRTEYAFVVACDMPFVEPALAEYLFALATGEADAPDVSDAAGDSGAVDGADDADAAGAADGGPYDAAVPRLEDGWFQTTQAVYRAEPMADACEAALDRGERRIVEPLFDLDYVVVGEATVREHADLRTFENVNTREELQAAAEELA